MAFVQLTTHDLVLDIPDIIVGETTIKRTATCFKMNYVLSAKMVVLTWIVKHYAKNPDGTKGEYLPFISDWAKESIADNTSMCDVTTGHPIEKTYDTGQVEKDDNGKPILDPDGNEIKIFDYDPAINYTGQYDFFFNLGESQEVLVNQMILQFGSLVVSWDKN